VKIQICPALLLYFAKAPKSVYVQAKARVWSELCSDPDKEHPCSLAMHGLTHNGLLTVASNRFTSSHRRKFTFLVAASKKSIPRSPLRNT
jgi:hypothetical protein